MTVCLASFTSTSGLCLREDSRGLEVTWDARTDFVSHSKGTDGIISKGGGGPPAPALLGDVDVLFIIL